eukprot:5315177-Amphidinium_carterae.2
MAFAALDLFAWCIRALLALYGLVLHTGRANTCLLVLGVLCWRRPHPQPYTRVVALCRPATCSCCSPLGAAYYGHLLTCELVHYCAAWLPHELIPPTHN